MDLKNIIKMTSDTLSNVLSHILNCEKVGKQECIVRPVSNLIKNVLEIVKNHKYIGDFSAVDDGRGGYIKIKLLGKINNCCVIKPRFSVEKKEFEKFEKRFLLAKDFGILIISTSSGMMSHNEAKSKGLGGRLIAFVY